MEESKKESERGMRFSDFLAESGPNDDITIKSTDGTERKIKASELMKNRKSLRIGDSITVPSNNTHKE